MLWWLKKRYLCLVLLAISLRWVKSLGSAYNYIFLYKFTRDFNTCLYLVVILNVYWLQVTPEVPTGIRMAVVPIISAFTRHLNMTDQYQDSIHTEPVLKVLSTKSQISHPLRHNTTTTRLAQYVESPCAGV